MELAYFHYDLLGKMGMIASKDALYALFFAQNEPFLDAKLASCLGKKGKGIFKLKPSSPNEIMQETNAWLQQYLKGSKQSFSVPFKLFLPPFSQKVLQTLFLQPFGELISYKDLAKRCGQAKAYRAVGNANNSNPLPIIIPCHRVIKSNGELGGYGCGIEKKLKLLEIEGISF